MEDGLQLAIHNRQDSFSARWMAYCDEHGIRYRVVSCLSSDIIHQLSSVNALLWHWSHRDPGARLMARQVIKAAEEMNVAVFPNSTTCWHFDDKVAQKYLLEAIGGPLVPTYVFYDAAEAHQWIDETVFPKVFKLRTGSGSQSVRLVRNKSEAHSLAKQAFTVGFQPVAGYGDDARKRLRNLPNLGGLIPIIRRLPRTLATIRELNQALGQERGYIYLQDYIPNNSFDTRVTVIGNRAFAFTRNVRPGDFRASGSGDIVYDIDRINPKCLRIAFDISRRIGSQSMAFDFVVDSEDRALILEVSYCYDASAVHRCSGYWDDQLEWHEGSVWPQDAILIDLLNGLHRSKNPLSSDLFV